MAGWRLRAVLPLWAAIAGPLAPRSGAPSPRVAEQSGAAGLTGLPLTELASPHRQSARSTNAAPDGCPTPAGEVDMRLAGPLRIMALVISVGLTWLVASILLGGPGGGFPRIQQLFASPENSVTAGPGPWVTPVVPTQSRGPGSTNAACLSRVPRSTWPSAWSAGLPTSLDPRSAWRTGCSVPLLGS
nr:protein FAM3A isoform X8 [Globicephala melas]